VEALEVPDLVALVLEVPVVAAPGVLYLALRRGVGQEFQRRGRHLRRVQALVRRLERQRRRVERFRCQDRYSCKVVALVLGLFVGGMALPA
jgi:hypothetical protein